MEQVEQLRDGQMLMAESQRETNQVVGQGALDLARIGSRLDGIAERLEQDSARLRKLEDSDANLRAQLEILKVQMGSLMQAIKENKNGRERQEVSISKLQVAFSSLAGDMKTMKRIFGWIAATFGFLVVVLLWQIFTGQVHIFF